MKFWTEVAGASATGARRPSTCRWKPSRWIPGIAGTVDIEEPQTPIALSLARVDVWLADQDSLRVLAAQPIGLERAELVARCLLQLQREFHGATADGNLGPSVHPDVRGSSPAEEDLDPVLVEDRGDALLEWSLEPEENVFMLREHHPFVNMGRVRPLHFAQEQQLRVGRQRGRSRHAPADRRRAGRGGH